MGNILGKNIQVSIFGESHNDYIGATISGLAGGIKIDLDLIKYHLSLRKPSTSFNTSRIDSNDFEIISGFFNGFTTGAPLTILIKNTNTNSSNYDQAIMRPSHADYSAYVKYDGFNDYRGGGHFSGRLTTVLVAVGSIALQILNNHNIKFYSHIKKIGNFIDDDFNKNNFTHISNPYFPLINNNLENDIINYLNTLKQTGDSIGGIVETCIIGLDAGLGEPFFDSLESLLSHAIFSIPSIKGIEFGLGFNFSNYLGSAVNDEFYFDDDSIKTKSNNNGGINGGISNGMPIVFRCVSKPIASISQMQNTINIKTKENIKYQINGRHDSCIINRLPIIIEAVSALVLLDVISERYGTLWMKSTD